MSTEERTVVVGVGGKSHVVTVSSRADRAGLRHWWVHGSYNGRYCEGPRERSEEAAVDAWVRVCGDPHGGRFDA